MLDSQHQRIQDAINENVRLRAELENTNLQILALRVEAFKELPLRYLDPTFTLFELQQVSEVLTGVRWQRDAFRRRAVASGLIRAVGKDKQTAGRPASLYEPVSA